MNMTNAKVVTINFCMGQSHMLATIIFLLPKHDKTNKMTSASSKDSDQHGHPPSLIRAFAVRSVLKTQGFSMRTAKNDQTGSCHFVGFVINGPPQANFCLRAFRHDKL